MARSKRRPQSRLAIIAGAASGAVILAAALLLFVVHPRHRGFEGDDRSPALASASTAPAANPASGADQTGYLTTDAPDPARFLPAPPAPGSPRAEADRRIYLSTRALKGSARWTLAISDDDQSVPATLHAFSCAVGVNLNEVDAPALTALLTRAGVDSRRLIESGKHAFNRKRPYLSEGGDICTAKTAELAASPDYPSGHATWGWMSALLLAELAPDRMTSVLARGRSYGESRAICGAHSVSAIEAGQLNGAALAAALHAAPAFKVDLEMARAELTRLRQTGSQPAAKDCGTEATLTGAAYY
jgi:acid phosphatase (class A)